MRNPIKVFGMEKINRNSGLVSLLCLFGVKNVMFEILFAINEIILA